MLEADIKKDAEMKRHVVKGWRLRLVDPVCHSRVANPAPMHSCHGHTVGFPRHLRLPLPPRPHTPIIAPMDLGDEGSSPWGG